MERKGISQVLFLIIAASVLMMVALTLIFMFQSGAGDTTQQAQTQTCLSSLEAQCSSFGDEYVRMPGSCMTEQAGEVSVASGVPYSAYTPAASGYSQATGDLSGADVYADCGSVL